MSNPAKTGESWRGFERKPMYNLIIHADTGGRNDGSNLRLVCECAGLRGANLWHYLQGDQRLGLCYHLAHLDRCSHWHYLPATENDQKIVEAMRGISMNHFIEIRSYNLKDGTRAEFHRLFLKEAFPMLKRWDIDVVAYGPSPHDQNSYYLIRRYDSLAQREQSEDTFYGSAEWRQGPREAIIALIENYTEIVLELDEATVQGLRK